MISIADTILAIKSDAQVSVINEDINKITWHDDNPTNITNKQITDKLKELQTEYDNNAYARKRKAEYPTIEECVHAILDDTLTELQTKRAEVKAKYPK